MPINRVETPAGWARYSSPSVATDYANPLTSKSPPPLPRPSPLATTRSSRVPHLQMINHPGAPGVAINGSSSGGGARSSVSTNSIHSTSLVYDTAKSRVATHFTPIRATTTNNNNHRSRIGVPPPPPPGCFDPPPPLPPTGLVGGNGGGVAGIRIPPSSSSAYTSYPDYEYTTPGEASPYSVSSELYKHVLPQYYSGGGTDGNKSVLV